jgi:hypothetical protein
MLSLNQNVRRLLSILLVVLILFNVLGYYGVFLGLRFKTTQELTHRLDVADYTEAETFTLKVPLAIPYHDDVYEYKRADGEIEYQGEFYHLVKQKLSKDTLYIVCLKDNRSKHLKEILKDYVKTFADRPMDASQQNAKTLPGFIKDYLPVKFTLASGTTGWHRNSISYFWIMNLISDPFYSITSPPPKA